MREPDEGAERRARGRRRDRVDEAGEQTFPASDAPGWGPLRVGAPREHEHAGDEAGPADDAPPADR